MVVIQRMLNWGGARISVDVIRPERPWNHTRTLDWCTQGDGCHGLLIFIKRAFINTVIRTFLKVAFKCAFAWRYSPLTYAGLTQVIKLG